jgi:hypothetical protein
MPMPHPSSPASRRARAATRRARASAAAAGAALAAGLLLAGCAPSEGSPGASDGPRESVSPSATATPDPSASATPSGSATPSESATPSGSATPTPTPDAGMPVTITCDALVPAQALYDFNPNFSTDPAYQPKAKTLPATLAADGGTACGYVNQTSGEVIEVAVAHPQPAELQRVKDALVAENAPVPVNGADVAYFTAESDHGQTQAFAGAYRIVARSTTFEEPADHADLMAAIVTSVATQQP